MNNIGYIPIANYSTNKQKVCEAPRHKGLGFAAYAAVAVDSDMYHRPFVQMVCFECWQHFDLEMGSPKWNLLERNDNDVRSSTR